MTITHIIALRLIPGAGEAPAVGLDVPGLEWTLKEGRLHYAPRVGRLQYTMPTKDDWGVSE